MKYIPLNKRIIFALDFNTVKLAKFWVNMLKDKIKFYKVGWQLFLDGGLDFIKWLKDQGVDVMLDLKFLDIPRTINAALNQIGDEADYITVHSQCNILKEISEEFRKKILGVTVLTCFDDFDIQDEHFVMTPEELVTKRTLRALENSCAGVVLSGFELKHVSYVLTLWGYDHSNFILVVPGIKIEQPRDDDQKRVVDIDFAFKYKADHLVIGIPIYNSSNPLMIIEYAQEKILNILEGQKCIRK